MTNDAAARFLGPTLSLKKGNTKVKLSNSIKQPSQSFASVLSVLQILTPMIKLKKKAQSFVLFAGCMILGTVVPAFPESKPAGVTPVRGVVASISDDTLTVKSQTSLVQIHTGSPLQVYRDIPSDLAHVNSASFVGVTSIKRPDGSESAKEIHIFPEELRGTGEGSYLLDQDQPKPEGNSRMTNGTVSQSRMTNGTSSEPIHQLLERSGRVSIPR